MPDRLASGNIVHKYSQRTTEEVEASLTEINHRIDVTQATLDQHYTEMSKMNDRLCMTDQRSKDNQEIQKTFQETMQHKVLPWVHDDTILMYTLLLSRPMRFLNWFAHWYLIDIYKGYSMDCPALSVYPATDIVNYSAAMKLYRKHLKAYKKEGFTYKKILQNTIKRIRPDYVR